MQVQRSTATCGRPPGWTPDQIRAFQIAARDAQVGDAKYSILSRCGNRAIVDGRPSSRSPKLKQEDFEFCMAVLEETAAGKGLKLSGKPLGYWQHKAADELQRMRYVARGIAELLEATEMVNQPGHRLLQPGGVGLAGWIESRVTSGRTDRLEDLTRPELSNLIEGLKKYAERHGLRVTHQRTEAA